MTDDVAGQQEDILDFYGKWEHAVRSKDDEKKKEWEEELADYLGCTSTDKMRALMEVMDTLDNNDRA